jgi:class 3 adenylate cyclase
MIVHTRIPYSRQISITFFFLRFVQSRNKKVENVAARSNAIVSSLFPSNVRDRLLAENLDVKVTKGRNRSKDGNSHVNDVAVYKSKPIADLFPETTVLFGDIVGFTAWSSVRDPTQVFTLLETVYHAFDEIAHKRRIFKVETIGDCYVGAYHC